MWRNFSTWQIFSTFLMWRNFPLDRFVSTFLMWRNFSMWQSFPTFIIWRIFPLDMSWGEFLHMTNFFSTDGVCGVCDKYQVCSPNYGKQFWASSSLIGFLLYFFFRVLLSSASLSEESLCRVSGENKSISLNVILATYCCPQYSNLCLIQQRWGFRGTTSKASTSLLTGQTSTSRSGTLRRFPQGGYFGKHFLFKFIISWCIWISRYRDQSLGFPLTLAATGRKVQVCRVLMTVL